MNPNTLLNEIRELANKQTPFKEDRWDYMVTALEKFQYLDNWLTAKSCGGKGGYLPDDWDIS